MSGIKSLLMVFVVTYFISFQVQKDAVLLKFQSGFHANYVNEEYNVRFTFNR
jgi:hypothetical protein